MADMRAIKFECPVTTPLQAYRNAHAEGKTRSGLDVVADMRLSGMVAKVHKILLSSGFPLELLDAPSTAKVAGKQFKQHCGALYEAMKAFHFTDKEAADNLFPELNRQAAIVDKLRTHGPVLFRDCVPPSAVARLGALLAGRGRGKVAPHESGRKPLSVGESLAVLVAVLRFPFSRELDFVDWFVAALSELLEAIRCALGVDMPMRHVLCAQRFPTLGSLRPDLLFTRGPVSLKVAGGALVLFIGEAKLLAIDIADVLGQMLQYGDETMRAQPFRTVLNTFIFNQLEVVFMQFNRSDTEGPVTSKCSASLSWGTALTPLIAMLFNVVGSDAPNFPELFVHGTQYTCSKLIGEGGSSYVYSTVRADESTGAAGGAGTDGAAGGAAGATEASDYVMKIGKSSSGAAKTAFANEAAVLRELNAAGVPGVPTLISEGYAPRSTGGERGATPYLVVQGRCEKFSRTVPFTADCAVELAQTIFHIGRLGYAHCDVRPVNIMFHIELKRLHVVDFGSAVRLNAEDVPFYGTLKCASSRVLASLRAGNFNRGLHKWSFTDDWHSWLRTCILLAHPEVKAALDAFVNAPGAVNFNVELEAPKAAGFWNELFVSNPRTYGAAHMRLCALLERMPILAGDSAAAEFPLEVEKECRAIWGLITVFTVPTVSCDETMLCADCDCHCE